MKKSKRVALLITGSVVLAACNDQPKPQPVRDWGASPTPSPTPRSWWSGPHWWWHFGNNSSYYHSYGGSYSGHSWGGSSSSGVARGGFGAHGSAGGS